MPPHLAYSLTISLLPHPSRGSWEAPEQSAHLLATVMDTAVALPIALGGRSSSCVAFFLWPLLARRPSFFSIY